MGRKKTRAQNNLGFVALAPLYCSSFHKSKKKIIIIIIKWQITDLQGSNPSVRGSLRLNVSCEEKRKIKEVSVVHCFLVRQYSFSSQRLIPEAASIPCGLQVSFTPLISVCFPSQLEEAAEGWCW